MNLQWRPPPDAVREADEQPWDGPAARALRPLTYATSVRSALAGALMYGLAGISTLLFAATSESGRVALLVVGVLGLVGSAAMTAIIVLLDPRRMQRGTPLAALLSIVCGGVLITIGVVLAKPGASMLAALYVEAPIFGFYLFRRRWAIAVVTLVAAEYAVAVALLDMSAGRAFATWFAVTSTVVATGVLVGGIAARAEQLSASEREARGQLAELNATLEQRVVEQVDELERLGRMRRFLSPQVADAVVSGGSEEWLQPHRRRIAVFFCDLRGFTAFTNHAEPEDAVQALDEYYAAVGSVLRRHEATIGGYAGDGIMAYFGDPVVSEAPAVDALQAVRDLQPVLDELIAGWARRGYQLGYGIGLAYGYATLGVVGFDERYDYTALGAVVNLAARLCAAAEPGQALLDQAMHSETGDVAASTPIDGFELKGFGADTRIYALGTPVQPGQAGSLVRLRRPS